MECISVRCNAKVNLYLRILGRRQDGFHDIETVYHSISLHDTLTLSPKTGGFSISTDDPKVPADMSNLALRAAAMMLEGSERGIHAVLEKGIPTSSGLGGGSADAAGALVGTDRLYRLDRRREEIETMAESLGVDVKFMLRGGCAIGMGRGDDLADLPSLAGLPLVLVIPPITVRSGWAYESFKMGLTSGGVDLSMITNALGQGDMVSLCDLLHNDFESLIFERFPVVREIKQDLLGCGADGALMTGSGPVVYGIFSKAGDAEVCKKRFSDRGLKAVISQLAGQGVTVPM